MRLSEMSTDRALDALCELTPYASNIMEDEQVIQGLRVMLPDQSAENEAEAGGSTAGIRMLAGLGKLTPLLLKNHRNDVYGVLSVINEKTPEDIAAQPVSDTIWQLRQALQDRELIAFFKSSAGRERTEPSAPCAPSQDSE